MLWDRLEVVGMPIGAQFSAIRGSARSAGAIPRGCPVPSACPARDGKARRLSCAIPLVWGVLPGTIVPWMAVASPFPRRGIARNSTSCLFGRRRLPFWAPTAHAGPRMAELPGAWIACERTAYSAKIVQRASRQVKWATCQSCGAPQSAAPCGCTAPPGRRSSATIPPWSYSDTITLAGQGPAPARPRTAARCRSATGRGTTCPTGSDPCRAERARPAPPPSRPARTPGTQARVARRS